ncbi:type II CRISPR-associated endonuclease Cas1 [Candidatus Neomarinimicrobiota bacterium]
MIKRTLYFGNPALLSTNLEQLVVKRDDQPNVTAPIEDIGVVVLDHPSITFSQALLSKLLDSNVAVISTDARHLPNGLFLPLAANFVQTERFAAQITASAPLKKQLWRQTIKAKIVNQARLLKKLGRPAPRLTNMVREVRSGDAGNHESQASRIYWKLVFSSSDFLRRRSGLPPNNLLNYGYAVLRAVIARALVAAGLLPTLGIHHHNRYNAYALADDLMEPYRPFVDEQVAGLVAADMNLEVLTADIKRVLLEIPAGEVVMVGERWRLMDAASVSAASLLLCFTQEARKLDFPVICP